MLKKLFYIILSILLLQLLITTLAIPSYIFPTPFSIIKNFYLNFNQLLIATMYTLSVALIGLGISIILGLFFAIIMDYKHKINSILKPIINISQLIPAIVLSPLLLIWFGFGISSTIILVVIMCIFPIITNTIEGFNKIDNEFLNLFRLMDAKPLDLYKKLKIPGAISHIFAGIRISTTYALTSTLLAEFMGAQNGLGVALSNSLASFNTVNIFCIIIITVIITLLMLAILNKIEKRYYLYEKIN